MSCWFKSVAESRYFSTFVILAILLAAILVGIQIHVISEPESLICTYVCMHSNARMHVCVRKHGLSVSGCVEAMGTVYHNSGRINVFPFHSHARMHDSILDEFVVGVFLAEIFIKV